MQRMEVERHLEDVDTTEGAYPDDRRLQVSHSLSVALVEYHSHTSSSPIQQYSNLFFLLQGEPRHIATLCRLVSLSEIDTLLQTVMFTLYGNQYESREEHLLLSMFQVIVITAYTTGSS